jgi:asparagine synthase (glutamine-hydrolysing)
MLDRRVVEFALSLPRTWHMREARKRRVFRDAMEGILPEKIRWRFDKLTPYPMTENAISKQLPEFLRIAQRLAGYPMVRRIFDMKKLQARIETLNSSSLKSDPESYSVTMALVTAAYVAQHFDQ